VMVGIQLELQIGREEELGIWLQAPLDMKEWISGCLSIAMRKKKKERGGGGEREREREREKELRYLQCN
jgi:hypothetical protein